MSNIQHTKEYSIFVWNKDNHKYEPAFGPLPSEMACILKYQSKVDNHELRKCYDTSRFELRYREISSTYSEWKSLSKISTKDISSVHKKQRVFIDIDGTLAVFKRCSTLEELLEPGYFRHLMPLTNVIEAVKLLNQRDDIEVFIISGYLEESKYAVDEKIEWLKQYLPEIPEDNYIFVPCSMSKTDFLDSIYEDDVILDDYWKQLNSWHGIPVKLFNGINGTSERGWDGYSTNCRYTPEHIVEDIMTAANSKSISRNNKNM